MSAIGRVAALALGVGLIGQSGAAEARTVTGVRFWSLGDITRIAIEVDGPFRFRFDRAANPPRLFFDIPDSKPAMAPRGVHTIPVGDGVVRQVRIAENQRGVTRVVLDLNVAADFTTSELVNPHRLMVEVRPIGLKPAPPSEAVPQAPQVPQPPVALPPAIRKPVAKVFVPPEGQPASSRPVVTIAQPPVELTRGRVGPMPRITASPMRVGPPPPIAPAKSVVPVPSMPEIARAKEPVRPLVTSATAPPIPKDAVPSPARRNTISGDRSMTRVLGLKIGRVVIDPGHGGHDAGTIGPKGLAEKDLVLDIAKRVGQLIETRMGSEVIYTRSDDRFIPLEARTELANEVRADLFLSIHANASPLLSASGSETFYLNFTTSRGDLDVAARENAGSQRSVFELKEMLEKIALKDKVDESREFAAKVQTSLYSMYSKGNPKLRNRGVKKAPFVVLIGASMPSVLAEVGFVSNPREEALLKKTDQRQKLAEALYKGLSAYSGTLSHFQVAKRDDE